MFLSGLRSMSPRTGRSLAWPIACLAGLCACSSVQSLEPALLSQSAPFLQPGVTTAAEIEGRLGPPYSSYEGGRIKIYHTSFDDRERLTLKQGYPCHALVLVFDVSGVLQRDALIKNGCGIREP